jgi:hypothetical protein
MRKHVFERDRRVNINNPENIRHVNMHFSEGSHEVPEHSFL